MNIMSGGVVRCSLEFDTVVGDKGGLRIDYVNHNGDRSEFYLKYI